MTAEEAEACAIPEVTTLNEPDPPPCDNERLTSYEGLLVITPHPDDEVLGFAGLIDAYLSLGRPVEVIVTTDGDAYCDACRFWKSGSVTGPTCDGLELSNLTTEAVDSFAEVRRAESAAAISIVGAPPPTFLGYPDTGLAASWANWQADEPDKKLRRSDFSACESCETCSGGYGEGPETDLTAAGLVETLGRRIADTTEGTLLATTHWLDGHGDHAALGEFVRLINQRLGSVRPIAFGVIHAHTPKQTPHSDCWYPGPQALLCPCADQTCASADPQWLASLRYHRFRPEWPATLPDDADYGDEVQLCLSERMYRGADPVKQRAIESYASQLGFAARSGSLAPGLGGLIDCNGYLISFVRRTEAFVLIEGGTESAPASVGTDDVNAAVDQPGRFAGEGVRRDRGARPAALAGQ
jgi:LmbE family N-acetylglucosaminyl deacetylase